MSWLSKLFSRTSEVQDLEVDPMEEILQAVDNLNRLVPSLPRGISLWIDYTPGPQKGTVILRRREFAEAVQVYPKTAAEEFTDTARRHPRRKRA